MVVAIQVVSAAGVFFLSAPTLSGRFAKALRAEMHAVNGRLGRVEGHMGISISENVRGTR